MPTVQAVLKKAASTKPKELQGTTSSQRRAAAKKAARDQATKARSEARKAKRQKR